MKWSKLSVPRSSFVIVVAFLLFLAIIIIIAVRGGCDIHSIGHSGINTTTFYYGQRYALL